MRGIVALLFVCGVFAQNLEESFTIFIDLDDFHLTQADNHEFLSHDNIQEHDNVMLQLSESEVKYYQKVHDTHSCEHPAEIHEVVSFIQEKMYEAPSVPNFVDDAITANYQQAGIWDQFKASQQAPNPFGGFGAPMGNPMGNPMWGMPMNLPKPQPQPQVEMVAPAQPVALDTKAAPQPQAATSEQDEEEAVRRFRDAYRAYKFMGHAVQGLDAPAGASAQPAKPAGSWLDNLMDDDDKRIFGMFANHKSAATPAFGFDHDMGKVVDEAMRSAMAAEGIPMGMGPVPIPNLALLGQPAFADGFPNHHRHHHHHRHEDAHDEGSDFSAEEKKMLKELLAKLTSHPSQVEEIARSALNAPATTTASVIAAPVAAPAPAPAPVAAPAMTSHIEKAKDLIPENVYVQQSVPFTEPAQMVKHVPKRILIPRMEEPGPVIGGSSRPVHIQLPQFDDFKMSNTRPAAPAQVQSLTSSSITTASETNNNNDVSVKSATVAAANDEALTQPEVVIF